MYKLNPNLKQFWTTRKPYKLLSGGRFSSKTQDAGGMAAFLARNYSLKFLCIRQFQNKIADSVYTVLKEKIELAGWTKEFTITNSSIKHNVTGSEFLFYGIARNIAEIKGTEGVDICWIEEGEGLTERQWEIIDPTIRKEGSEIWLLWNPHLVSDFVQTKLPKLLGQDAVKKHINYPDNPFLSSTAREKAIRLKAADPDSYEHIYLGIPKNDDDDVVIKRSWVMAAIDAHEKLGIEITGDDAIGFDVADSGNDKCAQIHRKGILAKWGEQWKAGEDQLLQSCTRVYSKAYPLHAKINYDSIGVGASSGSKFDELNAERAKEQGYVKVSYAKWIAGAGVNNPDLYYIDTEEERITNKDFFENLKAQEWWNVADRFRDTYLAVAMHEEGKDWRASFNESDLIAISSDFPDVDDLVTELSTPKRKFSRAGKVMVESKDDLKKREVDSPNYADSFIMAYASKANIGNVKAMSFITRRR